MALESRRDGAGTEPESGGKLPSKSALVLPSRPPASEDAHMQVIDSALARRHGSTAPTPLMEAYAHFRLDRQAIPCSKATMLTSTC
jgi:hypothetical protein